MSMELSPQQQKCYDCYIHSIPKGAESQSREDCHTFESLKALLESPICHGYSAINGDIEKAQRGDPTLGSAARIVQKLAENGVIKVDDMNVFDRVPF